MIRGFVHVMVIAPKSATPWAKANAYDERHLVERDPLDFSPLEVATTLCGIQGRVNEALTLPKPPLCRKCLDLERTAQ